MVLGLQNTTPLSLAAIHTRICTLLAEYIGCANAFEYDAQMLSNTHCNVFNLNKSNFVIYSSNSGLDRHGHHVTSQQRRLHHLLVPSQRHSKTEHLQDIRAKLKGMCYADGENLVVVVRGLLRYSPETWEAIQNHPHPTAQLGY